MGESNQEIGTVTLEHLWSDVYGIRIFRTETYANPNQWALAISDALNESEIIKAREVMFRLIKDEYSIELSERLPNLGFTKKNERVEFTKQIDLLPDNSGSPMFWKTAEQLKRSEQEIASTLDLVAVGDPGHDPNEDSTSFIQDLLSDTVLTSGLSCIHIGFIEDEVVAFTVVQINPKSGWSRISYMGIVPKFRSLGLGKWVHRYSFSVMKAEGGKLYRGGTDSTNTAMIKLFEFHQCERACHMEEWVYLTKRDQ